MLYVCNLYKKVGFGGDIVYAFCITLSVCGGEPLPNRFSLTLEDRHGIHRSTTLHVLVCRRVLEVLCWL